MNVTILKLRLKVLALKITTWLAVAAVAAPGALQWAVDNIALLGVFTDFDAETREYLRMVLVALIPVASALPQKSVSEARAELEDAEAALRLQAHE
ncbi:hypothetical protein H4CHR_03001 [Variovorax sp. PBS-H4]|uniref:hypothetical protein n=1 Tax=Variovorax sp. PBS-H4 TaxID=434008 RepID=UPI001318A6A6|nr:hypothetical protein [Variovorax sp. PBS-H4]VTU32387.1 hypothetical protein H4CHR_03001 [Variovorax sp. PBS-H4]